MEVECCILHNFIFLNFRNFKNVFLYVVVVRWKSEFKSFQIKVRYYILYHIYTNKTEMSPIFHHLLKHDILFGVIMAHLNISFVFVAFRYSLHICLSAHNSLSNIRIVTIFTTKTWNISILRQFRLGNNIV